MVGSDDDRPTRLTGFTHQRQQQAKVFQAPALVQLVRATQVIVHSVVDHAHNALLGIGNGRTHVFRQVRHVRQITLVKQLGRRVSA